jgi:CBS domain-containing protein
MKGDVECANETDSVETVAEQMRDRNIGFLPVCDSNHVVVGTITDRDLTLRVMAEHRDPSQTKVGDVMTPELVASSPDDDIELAEQRMSTSRKSRILCVDEQNHPLGVISLSDIARVDGSAASNLLSLITARETRL